MPYKEHASESGLGNVYIGKVDRDIVYNYIIEDLKEAIEYLPWMGEESYTVERMNKGFAKGLLAKVALFAGGWSVRDGNQFPDLDVEHHPTIPEMNGYFVGRPKNWKDYYELAAIATVGDVMDLQGENRILVKEGLKSSGIQQV